MVTLASQFLHRKFPSTGTLATAAAPGHDALSWWNARAIQWWWDQQNGRPAAGLCHRWPVLSADRTRNATDVACM